MSNKKYQIYTSQQENGWTAGITRRVTSNKTTVSKSQEGFASEAEALAWAETELQAFLKLQAERNKRHAR